VLSLATVLGLAAAVVAGSGTRAQPAASPSFLTEALGQPLLAAPPTRATVGGLNTKVERASYTVASRRASVSLAAKGVGDRDWRPFANGLSRPTAFGRETIVVGARKTEQFFTVEEPQGLRTWQWSLRSPGLRPRLTRDGAVEFVSRNRIGDLMIAPVAIFDASGKDVTPLELRWSLRPKGASWLLKVRLDDTQLPLPYVIDPAITFKSASSAGNMGATTLVINPPAGVVAGDFLIAGVTVRDNPVITPPSGWTQVRKDPLLATTITQAIYYKFAGSSEPANYTWTFSTSQKASGGIIAYTGVDDSIPIDASSGATGSGMSMTAPGVTTTVADAMVVGFFGIARSTGITAPTGMTERYQAQAGGGAATEKTTSKAADVTQATPGPTGNKTATAAQGADWVAQLVALRPKQQRTTSTTVDCPASTPANSPASCTVTVSDTDSAPKSPPLGDVDFAFTAKPAGSTPTITPDPCALTANLNGTSSSCTVAFTGDKTGSYTVEGTYQPLPASVHAASSGSDTISVSARTTSTTVDCPASTPANSPASCTVTVSDTDSAPKSPPLGDVDFAFTAQPAGSTPTITPDPCALTANLNGTSSSCTVAFNSTKAGDYTIRGTYQPLPASVHAASFGSDTISVTPGPPAFVMVAPATATNQVNTRHCVTATVTDEFGNPTPGVMVFFSVTGSNRETGSGTTGADGKTEFCYVGRLFGVDTITAVADRNENGQPDLDEPTGTATKTWTLPPSTPLCDVDFVTYGVRIIALNGDLANAGGNARVDGDGNPTGQHEYQDRGPAQPMNVHSINMLAVVCTAIPGVGGIAQIYGEATIDGAGSYIYRIDVEDRGEPGTSDKYWIALSNGYTSGDQTLVGGNVQIH
jgi:hypothetical protein